MDETLDRHEALRAIHAYCNGEAGVPFPALQRFAGPIYDLYGIEARNAFESATTAEILEHLSVMETAHLLWCYFRSEAQTDEALTSRVRGLLVGSAPTVEQEALFAALLETLNQRWLTIPVSLRSLNGQKGGAASLRQLLDELEPETAVGSPSGAVDSPDALAAFASPLLEDPSVADDPDRISEMMGRARDYWQLAQLDGDEFEQERVSIADRYGKTDEGRQSILMEAAFMVARFHRLFPQWTRNGEAS